MPAGIYQTNIVKDDIHLADSFLAVDVEEDLIVFAERCTVHEAEPVPSSGIPVRKQGGRLETSVATGLRECVDPAGAFRGFPFAPAILKGQAMVAFDLHVGQDLEKRDVGTKLRVEGRIDGCVPGIWGGSIRFWTGERWMRMGRCILTGMNWTCSQ